MVHIEWWNYYYIGIGVVGLFGIYIRGTGCSNIEKYLKKLEKKYRYINRDNAMRYDYFSCIVMNIIFIVQGIFIRGWVFMLISIIVEIFIYILLDVYIKRKYIIKEEVTV